MTRNETRFTTWQEAARKDIEWVFSIVKIMWKFDSRPIKIWSLNDIARRISTALILCNVIVSDCVMDDVHMQYNPAHLVDNFSNFQMATLPQITPDVEVVVDHMIPQSICDVVAVAGHWESLADEEEHSCLCSALIQK